MNYTSHVLHINIFSQNFCQDPVEILSESPLLTNSPTFWDLLGRIIYRQHPWRKFRQNHHFCQICHFRQIRQHFGTLQSRLMYSVERFRQDPWRNFVRIATFAKFAIFAKFVNILGPFSAG